KPRVYLSHRPERADSPVETSALFARPDFLNGEVDVIETTARTLPGPAMGGSAAIERYAPEEVRVHVEGPQPAVLILLDSFDKGCGVGSLRHNPRLLPRPLASRSCAHPPRRPAFLPADQTTLDRAALRRGTAAMVPLRCAGPSLHWRGPHRGIPSLHRALFLPSRARRVSPLGPDLLPAGGPRRLRPRPRAQLLARGGIHSRSVLCALGLRRVPHLQHRVPVLDRRAAVLLRRARDSAREKTHVCDRSRHCLVLGLSERRRADGLTLRLH